MFQAGIIGATGFAGAELVRILLRHPKVTGIVVGSSSKAGKSYLDDYPNFAGVDTESNGGKLDAVLKTPDEVIKRSDIVFGALPAGLGEDYAAKCLKKGVSYIDLSADFRFGDDGATYEKWYGKPYTKSALHEKSVYGLPEMNRKLIKEQAAPCVIGNPGCYPTGATLGALPALRKWLADEERPIIVDSWSGVTGSGRDAKPSNSFCTVQDALTAYKVGAHRHTPEIRRNFSAAAGRPVEVIFTPHLAPVNRGILSTLYIPLAANVADAVADEGKRPSLEAVRDIYQKFYAKERFVRLLPPGMTASTGRVRLSNFCDISLHLSDDGGTLIVVTAIDNMVKGAAGQAVQNMNIVMGYREDAGLNFIPASF
jgi:N-acetyl-gamma-glutamyl-phosphate reductase